MLKVLVLLLAAVSLHVTKGDINISDYIYWKKAEIDAWHHFFPCRNIEEEKETNNAAMNAVQDITLGLNDSLSSIVAFQAQELETAILLMQGTDAEGCINGIANFMITAVNDELDTCSDCMADALSKLTRLSSTWAKANTTYQAAYRRAMNGINACAKTYPNKDSIDRLKSCVESMNKNYFSAATAVQSAMYPSPSMGYFQDTIVNCLSTAANNVASKGSKFLTLMVDCAKLSGTIDIPSYEAQLYSWQGYQDTTECQITNSQLRNYDQVWSVEIEMVNYWNLQKDDLERYIIESRGMQYYTDNYYIVLKDYFNTVTSAALDNPTQQDCTNAAKAELDAVVNDGATKSLACDVAIVNRTKVLMGEVFQNFSALNTEMPGIGNAALLNCFSEGYIFAPSTISDCYNLVYSWFNVDHSDRIDDIKDAVATLQDYGSSFYNGTSFPCAGSSKAKLLLGGDKALYDLKRCMYKSSGTTYSVTTPIPSTTTTTTTTNTTW